MRGCASSCPIECWPRIPSSTLARITYSAARAMGSLRRPFKLLRSLRRFADIVVDRLTNHSVGELFEALLELLGQRLILGPQRAIVKRTRRADQHRRVPLPPLSVWRQPVAATQRHEELSRPRIVKAISEHDLLLPTTKLSEP